MSNSFLKTLYLVFPLLNKYFQGDYFVQKEMHHFRTIAQYEITIAYLKSYCNEFIVMQCINMHYLKFKFICNITFFFL
jgi:hypothetical protein